MNFGEFMAMLGKGNLRHVYLLSGEEGYYIRKAKERILDLLFPEGTGREDALQRIDGDLAMDELMGRIETAPFFADKNVLLLQDTSLFRERKTGGEEAEGRAKRAVDKKMEGLLRLLSDMPEYSYVIFVSGQRADKRKKIYKAVEKFGAVLEAEAVRPWNINDWLQGKLQSMNRELDREAYVYFASAVSVMQQISLEYLDKEFDKLALFSKERRITKESMAVYYGGL